MSTILAPTGTSQQSWTTEFSSGASDDPRTRGRTIWRVEIKGIAGIRAFAVRGAWRVLVGCLLMVAHATEGISQTATCWDAPTNRRQGFTDAREDAPVEPRPNIVWLISEDNSKHFLQRFDPSGAMTPNIDRLAEHGVSFQRAFSNAPVCSVARTTLMTGCFAPRIGTQFHRAAFRVPLPGDLRMFPYYLRQAGYYTSNRQKKDYNAQEGDGVWDESSRRASWRNRKPNQPFFHMQSFATSHESSLHFSQQQFESEVTTTDPDQVQLSPKHPATDLFRFTYARYHDRIMQVDQQIGDVIQMLEDDRLLDETFVFYFGDHGGVLPGSKGYLYETGLHVPLVIHVPKQYRDLCPLPLGGSSDGFVSFIDFAPTVLALAGAEIPAEMDGSAFLGRSVTADELSKKDQTIGYGDRFDERSELVRSLRRGKWKYIRNFQAYVPDGMQNNYRYKMLAYQQWRSLAHQGELTEVEQQFFQPKPVEMLFDLENDPYETRNLAGDPARQAELAQLRQELDKTIRSWPDLSFFPEHVLADKAASNPTDFGQDQSERIGRLLDAANLAVLPSDEREAKAIKLIEDDDPWVRLWAIRACTSANLDARSVRVAIEKMQTQDLSRLVRVAAHEYAALIDDQISVELIGMRDELVASEDPLEAASILNSMAILVARMQPDMPFPDLSLDARHLKPQVRQNDSVKRRLEYLATLE